MDFLSAHPPQFNSAVYSLIIPYFFCIENQEFGEHIVAMEKEWHAGKHA